MEEFVSCLARVKPVCLSEAEPSKLSGQVGYVEINSGRQLVRGVPTAGLTQQTRHIIPSR